MSCSIVWVEDEMKILENGMDYLKKEGFQVKGFRSFEEAMTLLRQEPADIVILDWLLPGISGLDACKWIVNGPGIPVIMVTAKSDEFDKVLALEIGADDYMAKPFGMRELVARIRTVLRRSKKEAAAVPSSDRIQFLNLSIDLHKHEARIDDALVPLTATEFKLLTVLASAQGRVFTRSQLIESCMGISYFGYERTLDSHIRNLRKKIEPESARPVFIHTVYSVGYKFGEASK
ncbi:response regulator transcription factor [Paenibacillus xanthanilyticus]|uniref:Response regulator transcription factor n=1 Tax=Paenibacillus xanthanilyticus TaxID=1783531 RepID=A0ABV8JZT8_9BACL